VDEGDVREHMFGSQAEFAMTVLVPACLGAVGVGSANREYRPSQLEGKAVNEILQPLRSVTMAALCETTEAVAAKGVRDVVALNSGKTKEARPKHVQNKESTSS
jgi:hypothetical protein